jgi:hypothetical protein
VTTEAGKGNNGGPGRNVCSSANGLFLPYDVANRLPAPKGRTMCEQGLWEMEQANGARDGRTELRGKRDLDLMDEKNK